MTSPAGPERTAAEPSSASPRRDPGPRAERHHQWPAVNTTIHASAVYYSATGNLHAVAQVSVDGSH